MSVEEQRQNGRGVTDRDLGILDDEGLDPGEDFGPLLGGKQIVEDILSLELQVASDVGNGGENSRHVDHKEQSRERSGWQQGLGYRVEKKRV